MYRWKKTHGLTCAEFENVLFSWVGIWQLCARSWRHLWTDAPLCIFRRWLTSRGFIQKPHLSRSLRYSLWISVYISVTCLNWKRANVFWPDWIRHQEIITVLWLRRRHFEVAEETRREAVPCSLSSESAFISDSTILLQHPCLSFGFSSE